MRLTLDHGPVIGQSASIRKVLRLVEQVAPTDSSVLLKGVTDTGKELIARAIHRLSPRRSHLMVMVNWAVSLPAGLGVTTLEGEHSGLPPPNLSYIYRTREGDHLLTS